MSEGPDNDQNVLSRALAQALAALSEIRPEARNEPTLLAAQVSQAVAILGEEITRRLVAYASSDAPNDAEQAYRRYVRDIALLKERVSQIERVVLDRTRFEEAREEWLGLTNLLDSALEPLIDLMTFPDPNQAVADLSQGYSFDSENVGFKRVRPKAS